MYRTVRGESPPRPSHRPLSSSSADGRRRWARPGHAATVADNRLWMLSDDGSLVLIDPSTGDVIREVDAPIAQPLQLLDLGDDLLGVVSRTQLAATDPDGDVQLIHTWPSALIDVARFDAGVLLVAGQDQAVTAYVIEASSATGDVSGSNTPSAPNRPLAEEQVIARGEIDGRLWRLDAQPFENGLMCMELTGGGGGCGSMPTDESPLGAVFHAWDSIEGSRFVFGAVVRDAAEVKVELANGEELSVDASQPAFGYRFYVIPIPAGPDAVAVTVRDEAGVELERVELGPTR